MTAGPVLQGRSTAIADLLATVDYIADDDQATAQALRADVAAKASCLADSRGLARTGRIDGRREMVVRHNYIVYIVVSAEDDSTLTILQVLHAAQQWP